MYKIIIKNKEFTIPKKNIVLLALEQALQRGIKRGKIHDEETAIDFLRSIGIIVEGV